MVHLEPLLVALLDFIGSRIPWETKCLKRLCWATIASLIETCKLNAVDPQAYLSATLSAIVNGHKQSRIDELLPWGYRGQSCAPKTSVGT